MVCESLTLLQAVKPSTAQKLKFFITNLFRKCDQIHWKLRIWSHLLKKSLVECFVFCAVKMQMYPRFVSVAHRHKYLKDVQILRSQGYKIFYQDAEILNKVGSSFQKVFLKISIP